MPYEYGYHGLLFPYSVNVQTIFASSQIYLKNKIIPQYTIRNNIISVICGSFCGISQRVILCTDRICPGKSIGSFRPVIYHDGYKILCSGRCVEIKIVATDDFEQIILETKAANLV